MYLMNFRYSRGDNLSEILESAYYWENLKKINLTYFILDVSQSKSEKRSPSVTKLLNNLALYKSKNDWLKISVRAYRQSNMIIKSFTIIALYPNKDMQAICL